MSESSSNDMRLNRYIAHSGVCSRRQADTFIKEGKVTVNGKKILEPGYRVEEGATVKFAGKKIEPKTNFVYILLNKPKDFITTTDDPQGRKTVMHLIRKATDERVYPVGRLDRATTGLLLFTNDGDLAKKLMHPSSKISKVYHVVLDKKVTPEDLEAIADGLELEDGKAFVDKVAYADPDDLKSIGIELHIGKNRIVRRIFEHLGYKVMKLDRVLYAGLTKKNLPRSKWRHLSPKEVIMLKHFTK